MQTLLSIYNRLIESTECKYQRYLHARIDWQERLIGVKGARGVGKTTLMLQHIKQTFPNRSQAFYVSLDNLWFSTHTLSDLVDYLYTHGVLYFFFDEVHHYPTWIREIKNIYDSYPDIHVVFTGSSLLELDNAEADLSRRLRMYHMYGLSFREYLAINGLCEIPAIPLEELLEEHVAAASSICARLKVLPLFEKYMHEGYYPFFLDAANRESYSERLLRVVSTVIENDMPTVEDLEYETLQKTKRLLMTLAQTVPFTPSVATLCETLSVTRNQVIRLLSLLERARLIRQLHAEGKNLKAIGKPEKILFDNPNLMQALTSNVDIGTARESFFAAMMSVMHTLSFPKEGDLRVDSKYTFEVGGRNKGFAQVRDVPDSYVVADEIETGFGNKVPLWLFGMMY